MRRQSAGSASPQEGSTRTTGRPLPELTLIRGSRVRLPSGQELADRFGHPRVPSDSIATRPEDERFRASGFRDRTPLWYYRLRESTVEGIYEPEPEGRHITIQKLGTIGSRIVAEFLYELLNADYHSIMHAGKGWRPRPSRSVVRLSYSIRCRVWSCLLSSQAGGHRKRFAPANVTTQHIP